MGSKNLHQHLGLDDRHWWLANGNIWPKPDERPVYLA